MPIDEQDKLDDPIAILDNMKKIVARERLVHGRYGQPVNEFDPEGLKLKEEGAICQGGRYCAVGALFVAAGYYLPTPKPGDELPDLVEAFDYNRQFELANYPAMSAAYDALNDAAYGWFHARRLDEDDLDCAVGAGYMERLFEGYLDGLAGKRNEDGRRADHAAIDEIIEEARKILASTPA